MKRLWTDCQNLLNLLFVSENDLFLSFRKQLEKAMFLDFIQNMFAHENATQNCAPIGE
jgi:hypothetical protein